jgi:hypothetical protein
MLGVLDSLDGLLESTHMDRREGAPGSTAAASSDQNVDGRAQAITVLTPIRHGWWIWLRVLFWVLGHVPSLAEPLARLSFIHYAHWAIVAGIPFNGGPSVRERLHYKYLLFESNFNGSWDQYIEAFSEVVGQRMTAIWGSSFGFPGPIPVEPFKAYIRRNEFVANYYWSAYPKATTTIVLQALELKERLALFQERSLSMSAVDFGEAYDKLLTDVQDCL